MKICSAVLMPLDTNEHLIFAETVPVQVLKNICPVFGVNIAHMKRSKQ